MPDTPATPAAAGPRVRPVPAVSRALAILRLLSAHKEALTLKAISQELALVTSTCLHILRVLVDEGMVRVDPATKRYSLDVGVLELAHSVVQNNPFPAQVQPALDRLSESWNVTTIGIKVNGIEDLVVLALARSRAPFRFYVEVGSRFPALTSATGRLVGAYGGMSQAALADAFQALRWDSAPPFDAWLSEVQEVRQRGVAIDRGHFMSGIAVVAVPILDGHQRMTHALAAVGVSDQFSADRIQALAHDMQQEALALSQRSGERH